MRPVLKPAVRLLWRGPTTVQLGVDPAAAVVLDGVDRDTARLLLLLDGTRDEAGVLADAEAAGFDRAAAARLLSALTQAGALDDAAAEPRGLTDADRLRLAPDLSYRSLVRHKPGPAYDELGARRTATVLLCGTGRVGAALAALLAAAGVGRLWLCDADPALPADFAPGGLGRDDAGRVRAEAAADAVRREGAVAEVLTGPLRAEQVSAAALVVVTTARHLGPPAELLATLHEAGAPYLLVGMRDAWAVAGPLVVPGRSSCPRCHDLARAERDPAWPLVVAQLASAEHRAELSVDLPLAGALAGLAAEQVLAHLAGGRPAAVDATLELCLARPGLRRRTWTAHPRCGCGVATSEPAAS